MKLKVNKATVKKLALLGVVGGAAIATAYSAANAAASSSAAAVNGSAETTVEKATALGVGALALAAASYLWYRRRSFKSFPDAALLGVGAGLAVVGSNQVYSTLTGNSFRVVQFPTFNKAAVR